MAMRLLEGQAVKRVPSRVISGALVVSLTLRCVRDVNRRPVCGERIVDWKEQTGDERTERQWPCSTQHLARRVHAVACAC